MLNTTEKLRLLGYAFLFDDDGPALGPQRVPGAEGALYAHARAARRRAPTLRDHGDRARLILDFVGAIAQCPDRLLHRTGDPDDFAVVLAGVSEQILDRRGLGVARRQCRHDAEHGQWGRESSHVHCFPLCVDVLDRFAAAHAASSSSWAVAPSLPSAAIPAYSTGPFNCSSPCDSSSFSSSPRISAMRWSVAVAVEFVSTSTNLRSVKRLAMSRLRRCSRINRPISRSTASASGPSSYAPSAETVSGVFARSAR